MKALFNQIPQFKRVRFFRVLSDIFNGHAFFYSDVPYKNTSDVRMDSKFSQKMANIFIIPCMSVVYGFIFSGHPNGHLADIYGHGHKKPGQF